jgi:hypothetical protein
MLITDRELSERDVQGLSSAQAIVGFLASLGYRTEARTVQAPANLGITAEFGGDALTPIFRPLTDLLL